MNKLKLLILFVVYVSDLYATKEHFLDSTYVHLYENCKVCFGNVNCCFNIADAIYERNCYQDVGNGIFMGPYMSKWQSTIAQTIDREKYYTEDMVVFCNKFHDEVFILKPYTYSCSFKNGSIVLNDKPLKYNGAPDTIQKFLLRPLERFKKKIGNDTSLFRYSISIEKYMDTSAVKTKKILDWIIPKCNKRVNYLYAIFDPFDYEGMGYSSTLDTLYIYGNNIYEYENAYDCQKSPKTDYLIFSALVAGAIEKISPEIKFKSQGLIGAIQHSLYFEYLDEIKSDIEGVEKESVRCIYRKYNYKIGEKSFDEFVSYFHSLYVKKKYRNNLEKLCAKILDDYNKVK